MTKIFAALALLLLTTVTVGCKRAEPPATSAAPQAVAEQSHDGAHDEHAEHTVAPTLPEGQLWPTDEPLRTAMLKIRAAVDTALPGYESRQLTPAGAERVAKAVDDNVAYMIANCKLQPEPDAALHVLIGRMVTARTALTTDPESEEGLPALMTVLQEYQATFDHPGWVPLSAHDSHERA